jgi:ATP-dependent RNA helicase RhlE
VNYELPNVPEDYVHRIGRTARAGHEGAAISLVCVDELKLLRDIEQMLGSKIKKENLPGYEVDPRIRAEPIQNGRSQRPSSARNDSGRKRRFGTPKKGTSNSGGPPRRRRKQA